LGVTEHPLLSLIGPHGLLDDARLEKLRATEGWSVDRICNELAWLIAVKFLEDKMPYEVADTALNWVRGYSFLTDSSSLPEPCSEIYLAFDQGEYSHPNDPADLDPVETYTRPLLKEIEARGYAARA
jgi:hypothetical protein